MRVVPEVGESVALAATLIGTPVLGLSTLLVSKLLQNPLGQGGRLRVPGDGVMG